MEKKELEQKQSAFLKSLQNSFTEADVFSSIISKEETMVADTLVVQHTGIGEEAEEAMGEYYFMPTAEEEDTWFQYFVEAITLSEDIPEDKRGVITAAISMINFGLPAGAFYLSLDGKTLFYRYTMMLEADMDPEHMEFLLRNSMINSIQIMTQWADALDALEYGRMTFEEFVEMV